jgi:hypothetical protein
MEADPDDEIRLVCFGPLFFDLRSTLDWGELWPMRQDELCDVDAESILKRDLQP